MHSKPSAGASSLRILQPLRSAYHRILPFHRNGWRTEWIRRRNLAKILATPPLITNQILDGDVAICLMCHSGDWVAALWAIKSFYYHLSGAYPLVVRVQGNFATRDLEELRRHLPTAHFVTQSEADQRVTGALERLDCPRLLELRSEVVHIQKLTDFAVVSQAQALFVLDSDILFFQAPNELKEALQKEGALVFQQDHASSYVLSPEQSLAAFGLELPERLNVGMMLFPRRDIDFRLCEEWLGNPVFDAHRKTPHIEQTLWALLASKRGNHQLLPPSYALSLDGALPSLSGVIARHYVSPVRHLFFDEGLTHLLDSGFFTSLDQSSLFQHARLR